MLSCDDQIRAARALKRGLGGVTDRRGEAAPFAGNTVRCHAFGKDSLRLFGFLMGHILYRLHGGGIGNFHRRDKRYGRQRFHMKPYHV